MGFLLFNDVVIDSPWLEFEDERPARLKIIINMSKPKIGPCGPPPGMYFELDILPFILTMKCQFERNPATIPRSQPGTPIL